MPRPEALTGDRREAALAGLAAGKSARQLAAELGVDHKTVAKLGRLESVENEVDPARSVALDQFEARQLAALDRIEAALSVTDTPLGISALVKAQNDTIKALRQHRLLRRPGGESGEEIEASAERVTARLARLAERMKATPDGSAAVTTASHEEPTGT